MPDGCGPDASSPPETPLPQNRGGTGPRYAGAFRLKKQISTLEAEDAVDNWRQRARVDRLHEVLEDATEEAIEARPYEHRTKSMEGVDYEGAIDKACHMRSAPYFSQWEKCVADKGDTLCHGWYTDYERAVDKCCAKLSVKIFQTIVIESGGKAPLN